MNWHIKNGREVRVKSTNFYREDEALLAWCEQRSESFSDFNKRILLAAMQAEQDVIEPSATVDADELVDLIRVTIRDEIARMPPLPGTENLDDTSDDDTLDALLQKRILAF